MRGKLSKAKSCFTPPRITPAHAGKTIFVSRDIDESWDHPRACGENYGPLRFIRTYLGSPPRMRGKLSFRSPFTRHCRITPAHAGKTNNIQFVHSLPQDHPRACGENEVTTANGGICKGSPPRMRGKPHSYQTCRACKGITPAHAGKTQRCAPICSFRRDHPRACGENRDTRR